MSNNVFFEKLNLGINLKRDELNEINQSYELLTGSTEQLTFKEYFFKVFKKAINSINNKPSSDESVIKKLQDDIAQLQKLHDNEMNWRIQLEAANNDLQNTIVTLQQENNSLLLNADSLTSSIASLKEELDSEHVKIAEIQEKSTTRRLLDEEIIVTFSPFENHLINKVAELESKRVNEPISRECLLKKVFFKFVCDGPSDYFRRPFSGLELKQLKQKFNN